MRLGNALKGDSFEKKFEDLLERVGRIEAKADALVGQLDKMEGQLGKTVDGRSDNIEERQKRIEQRQERIESNLLMIRDFLKKSGFSQE